MKNFEISYLLTILLCMVSITVTAHDIEAKNADGVTIYYVFANNGTELSVSYRGRYRDSYENEYTGNIVIPESVNYNGKTYPVTRIEGSTFYNCIGLISVIIPNNVTNMGNSVFYGCTSLAQVIIGNGVKEIGSGVFTGVNHRLESLTIGANVQTISENAFSTSQKPIKTIWLTNTPPNGYKYAAGIVNYVSNELYTDLYDKTVYPFLSSMFEVDGIKYVPVSPSERTCDAIDCAYNSSAENVHLGKTVNYLGVNMTMKNVRPYVCYDNDCIKTIEADFDGDIADNAFYGCNSLQTVRLANNGNVGISAFEGSSIYGTLTITNMGYIANKAFYNSGGEYDATINCNGYIGINAFADSDGIRQVTISDKVLNISESAFSKCGITSVTLGNKGDVGESAFNACANLSFANINIQGCIGSSAFKGCTTLNTATLGDKITTIGEYGFSGCNMLKAIVIPNAVTAIRQYAFSDCSSMAETKIGTEVKSIGVGAFQNCRALSNIEIPKTTLAINEYAFKGCSSLKKVLLEDREKEEGDDENIVQSFDDWRSTGSYDTKTYSFSANVNDSIKFDYYVSYYSNLTFEIYINGTKLKTIEKSYSHGKFSMRVPEDADVSIDFVNSIYYLDYNSFGGHAEITNVKVVKCSGGKLILDSNGSSPQFSDCPLDYVYIGRDLTYPRASDAGYSPFFRNTSLRSVKFNDSETEISENEFYGCTNLKEVKIGNGVTSIANRAFSGCSSLESFEFGSSTQSIGEEAFSDCTSMTSLTSHAAVPPTCGTQALDDINKWTCKLYVPEGCETAYQSANQWKEFFFMETFVDGIDHATTSEGLSEKSIKSIYDLQGRRHENLRQGINIVRMRDGTTRKVMVR